MLNPGALTLAAVPLAHYSVEVGAADAKAMVDAAADAGFDGMSITVWHHDWVVADGMTSEEFLDYHRERGLSIPAAEVILDWANCDRQTLVETNTHIIDVAARAGAKSVITAMLEPEFSSFSDAAERLRVVCDLAADRGLGITYEFLLPTAVPDLATAVRLLEAVDRDNLGLVLDPWHWFLQPGGPDVATLKSIPPERIHILQLNDVPAGGVQDWTSETMGGRLLPGEGVVDIEELLTALDDMGASPVVVSEVFSDKLRSLGVAENARRQYDALKSALERHQASRNAGPR